MGSTSIKYFVLTMPHLETKLQNIEENGGKLYINLKNEQKYCTMAWSINLQSGWWRFLMEEYFCKANHTSWCKLSANNSWTPTNIRTFLSVLPHNILGNAKHISIIYYMTNDIKTKFIIFYLKMKNDSNVSEQNKHFNTEIKF